MEIKNPHPELCLRYRYVVLILCIGQGLTVKTIYLLTMQIARIGAVSWVIAGGVGFFDTCFSISTLHPPWLTITPQPCLSHSRKQPSVASEGSCCFWNEVTLELSPVRVVCKWGKGETALWVEGKKKFVQKWIQAVLCWAGQLPCGNQPLRCL